MMIRTLAALAIAAHPAIADPYAHWGASSATLHPCHAADACVTVINRLSAAPNIFQQVMVLDGLEVNIVVLMGQGAAPDRAQVFPPVGWLVIPGWADVPEDGAITFRLFAPVIG